MDWTRRQILQAGGMAGAGALFGAAAGARRPSEYFGLHPFIEANPGAVFIRRTKVPSRMDAAAKRTEGLELAREIFVPMDQPGVPVAHRIILKPNLATRRDRRSREQINWCTDPDFYEGMVLALRELGLKKFHYIEANYRGSRFSFQYDEVHERYGIECKEPQRRPRQFRENFEMNWSRVPEGVIFQRIPYYPPLTEPDTWLFNIAKWRSHPMCITQSVKNAQGLAVWPFHRFCGDWPTLTEVPDYMKPEMRPDAPARVRRYFENHCKMVGYSRYQSPYGKGQYGALEQENWAHKTLDSLSVLKTGLAMVEAIYAWSEDRPGPDTEYLPNFVTFGKDPFRVDLVGLWLGMHEPANVYLYRIAKERGLSNTFNPWEVPLYEWADGRAVPRKLTDFRRWAMRTNYLRKEGEPLYHLANEPFDYDRVKV